MKDLWAPWILAKWNNTPKRKGNIRSSRSEIEESILLAEQELFHIHLEIEEYKKDQEIAYARDDDYRARDIKLDIAKAKRRYDNHMQYRQMLYWRRFKRNKELREA